MGLEYKIINRETKELDSVVCDRCNDTIEKESDGYWNQFGEPYSVYHGPHFKQEFVVIKTSWGYSSNKDGQNHEIVLCESCYDRLFDSIPKKVGNYD